MVKTVTLKIDDSIDEKFHWLLEHFKKNEVSILDQDEYIDDDEYLRSINGMVDSIKKAKNEPMENGVSLQELDW